jgi:hypothetical protein
VDLAGRPRAPLLVGRVARFHLDKMDLSLIQLDANSTDQRKSFEEVSPNTTAAATTTNPSNSSTTASSPNASSSTAAAAAAATNTKPQSVVRVLRNSVELAAPDWVLQSRRLGALLIGVSTQAARPVSLAKEWEPLAKKLLAEHADMVQSPTSTSTTKLVK